MRILTSTVVVSALLLSGCASGSISQPATSPSGESSSVSREASIRGSRVCFLLKGNGTITVAPSPHRASDAVNPTGDAGEVTNQERCFTGYNAYLERFSSLLGDPDLKLDVVVDISSPNTAMRMYATNYGFGSPEIGYDTDFSQPENLRQGKTISPSEGYTQRFAFQGFKFSIERRTDSAEYKEYLVTLFTPAN